MNKDKIVFLFSGQGSQYPGMGEKLYTSNVIFSNSIQKSDDIIKKYSGRSLIQEIYTDSSKDFSDLLITHPAIVAIELAMLEVMQDIVAFDYAVGNSLGEIAASVACGIINHETAIHLALEQARAIIQNNEKGGMLVVQDMDTDSLREVTNTLNVEIASVNYANNVTLSVEQDALSPLEKVLKRKGKQYFILPVEYAFHHQSLNVSKPSFLYHTYDIPVSMPNHTFVSGVDSAIKEELSINYFWNLVVQPSDIIKLVHYMEEKGPCIYIDLGPSGTMSNLVKYNLPETSNSVTFPIMTQFRKENKQINELKNLLKDRGLLKN